MSTVHARTNGSGAVSYGASEHQGQGPEQQLARALGWASLGLGVPQVTMPGRFDEAIGVRPDASSRFWTLVVGIREHLAAAGILGIERPRPKTFLWARVAGDAMDLTLLGKALQSKSEHRARTLGAIGAVVGIGIADVIAAVSNTRADDGGETGTLHLKAVATVRKPVGEVYGFWRDFQNFPRFMAHLESVEQTGDRRSHWRAKGPAGRTVEWDAELVEDRPNELIAWRSRGGSMVPNSGSVRFKPAPGDRGTEIRLEMQYSPPGGPLGAAIAKIFGAEPAMQVKDDLRRFKQIAETGIIVRSEGTPEGPLAKRYLKQRPAQPMPPEEAAALVGASV